MARFMCALSYWAARPCHFATCMPPIRASGLHVARMAARSLSDIAVRDEAKDMRPDARPQTRKNRRRIRWNTLRIFQAEHDADGRGSFAAVERSMPDRLLVRTL